MLGRSHTLLRRQHACASADVTQRCTSRRSSSCFPVARVQRDLGELLPHHLQCDGSGDFLSPGPFPERGLRNYVSRSPVAREALVVATSFEQARCISAVCTQCLSGEYGPAAAEQQHEALTLMSISKVILLNHHPGPPIKQEDPLNLSI